MNFDRIISTTSVVSADQSDRFQSIKESNISRLRDGHRLYSFILNYITEDCLKLPFDNKSKHRSFFKTGQLDRLNDGSQANREKTSKTQKIGETKKKKRSVHLRKN